MPHVAVSPWEEGAWKKTGSVWTSERKTEIRMTISIGDKTDGKGGSVTASIRWRQVPVGGAISRRVLDTREHDICRRIVMRIAEVLRPPSPSAGTASIRAIRDSFDEFIVSEHLKDHHGLQMSVSSVFEALHKLSEQTYEARALTFGCLP